MALFIWLKPDPRRFDYFKGQYGIESFEYKNVPNKNFEGTVLLIDNLSNGINIGDVYNESDEKNQVLIGKYEFDDADGRPFLNITKSKSAFLNGKYAITIDTLEYNKQFHNFRITFASASADVKIVTISNTTYLNF